MLIRNPHILIFVGPKKILQWGGILLTKWWLTNMRWKEKGEYCDWHLGWARDYWINFFQRNSSIELVSKMAWLAPWVSSWQARRTLLKLPLPSSPLILYNPILCPIAKSLENHHPCKITCESMELLVKQNIFTLSDFLIQSSPFPCLIIVEVPGQLGVEPSLAARLPRHAAGRGLIVK